MYVLRYPFSLLRAAPKKLEVLVPLLTLVAVSSLSARFFIKIDLKREDSCLEGASLHSCDTIPDIGLG